MQLISQQTAQLRLLRFTQLLTKPRTKQHTNEISSHLHRNIYAHIIKIVQHRQQQQQQLRKVDNIEWILDTCET